MRVTAARLGSLAITPVAGDSPTGRLLPDHGRLDDLVFAKLFNTVDPNPDAVDWPAVLEEGIRLLEQSRDLRFARWVAHALIEMEGLVGLEQGVDLFSGLVTTFGARLLPEDTDKKKRAIEGFDVYACAALERHGDANGLKGVDVDSLLVKLKALGERMSAAESGDLPRLSRIEQWLEKRIRPTTAAATAHTTAAAPRASPSAAPTSRGARARASVGSAATPIARFHEVGTTPISTAAPAGPRLTDWGRLATEYFQKLSSPMAAGEIDWRAVVSGGLELLGQSKDLRVACVATTALMQSEALSGLKDGVELIALLSRSFGDKLHPEDAAERARKLEALDAETATWLVEARPRLHPEAIGLVDGLLAAVQAAQASLGPLTGGDPVFRRLKRATTELRGQLEDDAEEARRQASRASEVAARASGEVGATGTACASGARAASPSGVATVAAPASIESPAQLNQVLADVNKLLRVVARYYRAEKPLDPLGRRLERLGLWSRVVMRPKDGVMEGPGRELAQRLAAAVAAGESPVEELERACSTHIFWLTGQRLLHDCVRAGGDDPGAASIRAECVALVAALPGLDSMTFKDGEPAADSATLDWLSHAGSAAPMTHTVTIDATAEEEAAMAELRKQAQGLLRKKQLAEAVALYESRWKSVASARETFRLKFDLARLLARQHAGLARSLLLDLEARIEEHELARWEPSLAAAVYAASLALCPEKDGPRREALLTKMVQVDAKRAASV